ncbi:MAG: DMT family transporter [Pseudomonadota bacterium]
MTEGITPTAPRGGAAALSPAAEADAHRRGVAAAVLAVAVLVPDTLLIRLVALDPFALAALRAGLGGVVVTLGCWLVFGRELLRAMRGLGLWGLALALLEAVSVVFFVLSVSWTTVANTMLAFAATPMLSALLARLALGERLAPQTAAAIAAVAAGLGIVTLGAWEESALSLQGMAAGVGFSLTIAVFFVILRRLRSQSAAPVIGPGWLVGALAALPFATFEPMSGAQWLGVAAMGAVIMPLAIVLLAWASRRLPAAEVSMFTLLEVVCAPILVWAVLGEEPGVWTLAGGALVMGALALHTLWRLRGGRARVML